MAYVPSFISSASVRQGSSEIVAERCCRSAEAAIVHTGCTQLAGRPGMIWTTPQARADAANKIGIATGRACRWISPGLRQTDMSHTTQAAETTSASTDHDQPRLLP